MMTMMTMNWWFTHNLLKLLFFSASDTACCSSTELKPTGLPEHSGWFPGRLNDQQTQHIGENLHTLQTSLADSDVVFLGL